MTGVTHKLAEFVAELSYDDLPEAVVERTKLLILDITGIMVRARRKIDRGMAGEFCRPGPSGTDLRYRASTGKRLRQR